MTYVIDTRATQGQCRAHIWCGRPRAEGEIVDDYEFNNRSKAWVYTGRRFMRAAKPGVMELNHGQLTLTTDLGVLIDAPILEVAVSFPWYEMGGGCRLRATGDATQYLVSFARPNATPDVPGHLMGRADKSTAGELGHLLTPGRNFMDAGSGVKNGREWKRIFRDYRRHAAETGALGKS
jgi:hypothetical protein